MTSDETTKKKAERAKAERQEIRERLEAAEKSTGRDEPTYHVDEHIELAYAMYGEPAHVIAGAVSIIPGNKKNFTKSEMSAAIASFKKHKVQ